MIFEVDVSRWRLRAIRRVKFGPHAGNTLRGALGYRLADSPEYAAWFRPELPRGSGPSGLAEPPRPFVLRASHLDGTSVDPGETFSFAVHSFDTQTDRFAVLQEAIRRLGAAGMGVGRGTAELLDSPDRERIAVSLTPPSESIHTLRVHYLTPTELKGGDSALFATLFSRARDRVATLMRLYANAAVEADFRGMGERAASVRTVAASLVDVHAERRSTRTGQTHRLGGCTGHVDFEGELAEFVPWLAAAQWAGVGRHTVWGKGAIRIDRP